MGTIVIELAYADYLMRCHQRGTLNRISSATQETSFCLLRVAYTQLTGMADESLFDFLHMEIVSHMYTEQQSSKGEMDNKDRAVCVSVLESMGFRVGQGIIERLTRDSPSFKDELDVMKFVCKDFWTKVFRRQVDNLRTNHQGTYVLQDNKFSFLTQLSSGKQYLDQAPKYLAFSCGVVRGALSNLGMDSVVTAEVSVMPSCKFQVVVQKL
ncbi:Trafficking protein particle complex subunit 6B [Dissostichus eleginoides]|nr:Trafficking protein particle complex subunit 6B [Dissostichus eleginoides]